MKISSLACRNTEKQVFPGPLHYVPLLWETDTTKTDPPRVSLGTCVGEQGWVGNHFLESEHTIP